MSGARPLREVLGRFPTGVTIVTARDPDGAPVGLTVSSFTSVSLDPPLVLVCIDRLASSHPLLLEARSFAVNILGREQAPLAARFAREPGSHRFDGVRWDPGPLGDPVLASVVAWLACELRDVHSAGDHSILVGRVRATGTGDADEALVFHRGTYGSLTP